MAETKQFRTAFLIGSKFDPKGFNQADAALSKTQKAAAAVHRGLGVTAGGFVKLAGAIGVAAGAYKVLAKAQEFWASGMKASEQARDLQEKLGVAAVEASKKYKQSSATIIASVNATAEAVAKFGFDSEDAVGGTTALLKSMKSTRDLQSFGQAFANIVAKTRGATPGLEGFQAAAEDVNQAILRGKSPLFKQLGWTDAQTKAFKELAPAARYAALQQWGQVQLAGQAAATFETTAGKAALAAKALEDLGQTITAPVVERQKEMAEAQLRLYTALQPVAELIAKQMVPALENFSKWTVDNQGKITEWGTTAVTWTKNVWNAFWWLQGQSESFFKPIADNTLREINNVKLGFEAAWKGIQEIWGLAVPYFTELVESIKKLFAPLYDWIIKPFKDAYDYLIKLWPNLATYTPPTSGSGAAGTGGRQEGDYVPEWEKPVSGRMDYAPGIGPILRTDESRGAVTQAAPSAGLVPDAEIAAERAKLMDELSKNPALEKRFAAIISKEQGSGSGRADVMEATVNRALSRGQTMQQALGDRFFGPQNRGEVDAALRQGLSQKVLDDYAKAKADVAAGRNRLKGMTDQGMANEIHSAERIVSEGEHYGRFGTAAETRSAAWRRGHGEKATKLAPGPTATTAASAAAVAPLAQGPTKAAAAGQVTAEEAMMHDPRRQGLNRMIREMNIQQKVGGATGGQSVAMNGTTINVHGVSSGRETMAANKVKMALRDPLAEGLRQLRAMKAEDNRTNYV